MNTILDRNARDNAFWPKTVTTCDIQNLQPMHEEYTREHACILAAGFHFRPQVVGGMKRTWTPKHVQKTCVFCRVVTDLLNECPGRCQRIQNKKCVNINLKRNPKSRTKIEQISSESIWKRFGREQNVSRSLYQKETILISTFCWVWGPLERQTERMWWGWNAWKVFGEVSTTGHFRDKDRPF